ncbi:MAG: tRNA (adenosine(37)-N6)-threonylcarbamoyltransferase complex dimerization subunit type 1 TsaB [Hyphomicrobiaceae bacterium]
MNILAIDCCLGALSVAIGQDRTDGRYDVTECYEERTTGHAERLVPMIEDEMRRAGLAFGDLARVAVTLGPGTFTGVRTGVAVARALRLSAGVEVVGLSSLAVMAHRVFDTADRNGAGRPVMIAVDARRGRLYAQLFGQDALAALGSAAEIDAETAAALAIQHGARVAGSGASQIAQAAAKQGAPDMAGLTVVCEKNQPHASDLAWLAPRLEPIVEIKPFYIRQPDAKAQADKRLARAP